MFVLLYEKIFKKENIRKIYPYRRLDNTYDIRIGLFEGENELLTKFIQECDLESEMKSIFKKIK
jgi:hypothetical protein